MKPLHTFAREGDGLEPLARGVGLGSSWERFIEEYRATTGFVRESFEALVPAS